MSNQFDDIKQLITALNDNAEEKGFWDSYDSVLDKMVDANSDPNAETDLFSVDDLKQVKNAFIVQKIMLVVTELSEAVEAIRKERYSDDFSFEVFVEKMEQMEIDENEAFVKSFNAHVEDSFQVELADALIRLFDLTGKLGIDIMKYIELKARFNESRDKLHNKRF